MHSVIPFELAMKASIFTPQNSSNNLPDSFISGASNSAVKFPGSISKALEKLVTFLSGSTDIKVSQALDSNAQVIWYVYDPSTDSELAFSSESEVRIWLEQRHR